MSTKSYFRPAPGLPWIVRPSCCVFCRLCTVWNSVFSCLHFLHRTIQTIRNRRQNPAQCSAAQFNATSVLAWTWQDTIHKVVHRWSAKPNISPPDCATSRLHPATRTDCNRHAPITECHRNSIVWVKPAEIVCHGNVPCGNEKIFSDWSYTTIDIPTLKIWRRSIR